jgi:hypothetical protein
MQTIAQPSAHERTVVSIMRKLPPERILELVDFARFLELQSTKECGEWLDEEETETEEEICANEEKWDQLLAQPDAKRVLREMAYEAREDYRAGQTTDITITEDGRLAPA